MPMVRSISNRGSAGVRQIKACPGTPRPQYEAAGPPRLEKGQLALLAGRRQPVGIVLTVLIIPFSGGTGVCI